jgi:hypothetical protein
VAKSPYNSRLSAGLGLISETVRLLQLWETGLSAQELFRLALESGAFPALSARRLRNMIVDAFAPRYLVDGGQPARVLKILLAGVPPADLRQLYFLYTCRATPILADFVRDIYWSKYAAGSQRIAKDDARKFVLQAVGRGLTTSQWSETTVTRVSRYLLGISADYGLLGPIRSGSRPIIPFRIIPITICLLAYDLHFKGLTDNAVVGHDNWRLFGLDQADVLQELKQLALRGRIIVQSAAGLTRIGWKHGTIEELAHVLSES